MADPRPGLGGSELVLSPRLDYPYALIPGQPEDAGGLQADLDAIAATVNALGDENLDPAAKLPDTKLVSLNARRRVLGRATFQLQGSATGLKVICDGRFGQALPASDLTGVVLMEFGALPATPGLVSKAMLSGWVQTNAVPFGVYLDLSLHLVDSVPAGPTFGLVLSTQLATVRVPAPGASQIGLYYETPTSAPTDEQAFVMTVSTPGPPTANAVVNVTAVCHSLLEPS